MGQITSRIVNTITDSQSENLRHERVASEFSSICFSLRVQLFICILFILILMMIMSFL